MEKAQSRKKNGKVSQAEMPKARGKVAGARAGAKPEAKASAKAGNSSGAKDNGGKGSRQASGAAGTKSEAKAISKAASSGAKAGGVKGGKVAKPSTPSRTPAARKPVSLAKMRSKPRPAPRAARRAPSTPAPAIRRAPVAARKRPFFDSLHVLWTTGIFGGLLTLTAALWFWQPSSGPTQAALSAPTAGTQSTPSVMDRSPAAAAPPVPQAPAAAVPAGVVPAQGQSTSAAPQAAAVTAAAAVSAPPAPAPVSAQLSPELTRAFEEASKLSTHAERVAYWSRYLWNAKGERSALSSLGEAPSWNDTAPGLPERFDCTTYVETAMALAMTRVPSEFYFNLARIRYRNGNPGFLTRNHFPEADWLPNNERAGLITDITGEVARGAGLQAQVAHKTVNRGVWAKAQAREQGVSRSIASASEDELKVWGAPVKVGVNFVPASKFSRFADRIPNGAILSFVQKSDDSKPTIISHQGIAVREGGEVLLRHVTPGGNVRTVVLSDYLRAHRGFVGLNVSRMNDQRR